MISDQTTYMSINPVSRPLLPDYGPLAGANNSPTARPAAPSNEATVPIASRETAVPAADPNDAADSEFEGSLRRARMATGASTPKKSNSETVSNAPAIGLYQRVSKYSDDRPSASGLLKSWNDIVRENRFEDAGVAGYVKAAAQNDAATPPARVLNLTA